MGKEIRMDVSDVKFYDYVLSDEEIMNEYQNAMVGRELERLRETASRRLKLLKKLEYVPTFDDWSQELIYQCPWCEYKKGDGHWSECELAKELEDGKA